MEKHTPELSEGGVWLWGLSSEVLTSSLYSEAWSSPLTHTPGFRTQPLSAPPHFSYGGKIHTTFVNLTSFKCPLQWH